MRYEIKVKEHNRNDNGHWETWHLIAQCDEEMTAKQLIRSLRESAAPDWAAPWAGSPPRIEFRLEEIDLEEIIEKREVRRTLVTGS